MAYTAFFGYQQTFSWNGVPVTGLKSVELSGDAGPGVEQKDVTTSNNTGYTFLPDPWGAKGSKKVTLKVTCQDSHASYADATQTKFAFNDKQAVVWCMEPGTANANQWDHTAMELVARTTTITWTEPDAEVVLEFEGTILGTWSSPA